MKNMTNLLLSNEWEKIIGNAKKLKEVSFDISNYSFKDSEKDLLKTTNKFIEEVGELAEVINAHSMESAKYKNKNGEDFKEELADSYLLSVSWFTKMLIEEEELSQEEVVKKLDTHLSRLIRVCEDDDVRGLLRNLNILKIPMGFLDIFKRNIEALEILGFLVCQYDAVDYLPKKLNKWKSLVEKKVVK